MRRSRITPGDTVVVQGAGPIGLLALQFARAAGAGDVLVIEPSPARRRLDELEVTLRGLSAGPSDDIKILVDPRRS